MNLPDEPDTAPPSDSPPATGNTPEAIAATIRTAMEQVPFGRWLGLTFTGFDDERVLLHFRMRDEFVGNPTRNALHGGIIAAVLDTFGGLAAFRGILAREPAVARGSPASPWLSTIDLRTDYLRPGTGDEFTASAFPLRVGSRLVVIRMELHGASGDLVAVGTGTYAVP